MDWKAELKKIDSKMMDVFAYLHAHPETSWEERETTKWLCEQLQALGLRVQTFSDGTGVVAEWGPVQGPVVALRSDIDALWQEVDGIWCANHSCGHDGHMTTVLGAVHLLRSVCPDPPCRIRVIFQPAEETGEGALRMVERGALDDVVYLYGLHLRPIEEMPLGKMSAAIRNGGAVHLNGVITGCDAHGARPHLGVNAIEVGFAVMQAAQSVHGNPMVPHSVKMTRFEAGGKSTNIIPGTARFSFDLRAQTNEALQRLADELERKISGVCAAHGATVDVTRDGLVVAAEVSHTAQQILADAIRAVQGDAALVWEVVTPGAEDFHYYTRERPNVHATMLGLGCNLAPGLHHPKMTFVREALLDGMAVLAETVRMSTARVAGMSD